MIDGVCVCGDCARRSALCTVMCVCVCGGGLGFIMAKEDKILVVVCGAQRLSLPA